MFIFFVYIIYITSVAVNVITVANDIIKKDMVTRSQQNIGKCQIIMFGVE